MKLRSLFFWIAVTNSVTTLALAGTELDFPRLSFEAGTITGVAIVNPNDQPANVTITAYGTAGQLLVGPGFRNPVTVTIDGGKQYTNTTTGLFGGALPPETVGWFRASSPASNLTGFFLFLNQEVSFLDGADLPRASLRLVFDDVRVTGEYSTELNLINPNLFPAVLQLELRSGDATTRRDLKIPARGARRLDVAPFFDTGENFSTDAYVVVSSKAQVAGFELVRGVGDVLGLNGRPVEEAFRRLYFPQLAVLGPFQSELVVVNHGDEVVILTCYAYQPGGELYRDPDLQSNPVSLSLAPFASLRRDVAGLFGFSGEDVLDGWIKVEATGESVQGSLSYALPSIHSRAAVSGVSRGSRRALFSHIATTLNFFTGVAVLNSSSLAANVRIMALTPDGHPLGSFSTTLRPGQRLSKLIDELIPEAAGQAGGLIWVTSDIPVYLTSLFGNTLSNVLSNIPPQPVPKEYDPDKGQTWPMVDPPLAVVPPGQGQEFHLTGASGPISWQVNGTAGGTSQEGIITAGGHYQAPANVPDLLPLTVSATGVEGTAGASVDVLEKELLVAGLAEVRAVVYSQGLERLYAAELTATAGLDREGERSPTASGSAILDVTEDRETIAEFPGEEIAGMVAYSGFDGIDYLLLAAKKAGQILRLNPESGVSTVLASGLEAPTLLVLDPLTNNLLVAEASRVASIPAIQLNQALDVTRTVEVALRVPLGVSIPVTSAGLAVDQCTGDFYLSDPERGAVIRYDRDLQVIDRFSDGLDRPGRLLAVYRNRVGCPESFQLLVADLESGLVSLLSPSTGVTIPWIGSESTADLTFLPAGNSLGLGAGVIAAETVGDTGRLSFVETFELYDQNQLSDLEPLLVGSSIDGLVAYYPFDGNARDLSGFHNHAELQNGAIFVPGIVGQAVRLDGLDDRVDVPDAPFIRPDSDFSLALWVRPKGSQKSYADLLRKEDEDENSGFGIEMGRSSSPNRYFAGWKSEAASYSERLQCWLTDSIQLSANQWQHLVLVKRGLQRFLYLDGEVVDEATCTGSVAEIAGNEAPLQLGAWTVRPGREWAGEIDELYFFSKALSDAEIRILAFGASRSLTFSPE